jgi:hypothetical protein
VITNEHMRFCFVTSLVLYDAAVGIEAGMGYTLDRIQIEMKDQHGVRSRLFAFGVSEACSTGPSRLGRSLKRQP